MTLRDWLDERETDGKSMCSIGGGGGGGQRTQTSMPVVPDEYKPLVNAQVQALLGLQQALPISSFAAWNPRPVAPMSAYTQEFMNMVPLMQVPTFGLQSVANLGPRILDRTAALPSVGSADRQNVIYQQMASRPIAYSRPSIPPPPSVPQQ